MALQNKSEIPEQIITAAASMLQPYYAGLTPEKLAAAITFQPEPLQEKLLSRNETATRTHMSLPSVDRSLRDGTLTPVRIRGRVFVKESQVMAIINGGEAK